MLQRNTFVCFSNATTLYAPCLTWTIFFFDQPHTAIAVSVARTCAFVAKSQCLNSRKENWNRKRENTWNENANSLKRVFDSFVQQNNCSVEPNQFEISLQYLRLHNVLSYRRFASENVRRLIHKSHNYSRDMSFEIMQSKMENCGLRHFQMSMFVCFLFKFLSSKRIRFGTTSKKNRIQTWYAYGWFFVLCSYVAGENKNKPQQGILFLVAQSIINDRAATQTFQKWDTWVGCVHIH